MVLRLLLLLVVFIFMSGCSRHTETIDASSNDVRMQVCFTPGQDCTTMLVDAINGAQKSIEVQAYGFTAYPIAKALVSAKERGLDVEVILDKTNFNSQYFSFAGYLFKHGIVLYDDNTVSIAHNKVMIFDGNTVETGSFNFTKAAQAQNAENMLIVHNTALAAAYLQNWHSRQKNSVLITANNLQN